MTFKKLLQYTLSIVFSGALFMSCDKVEEPFTRKITVDTTQQQHVKRVLLEDYTGHMCPNCPDAAVVAQNLKNYRGDKLVVIAIHAGWFAKSLPGFTADYTTPAGNEWDTFFGISNAGNPNGMVNRKYYTTAEHILSPSAWSESIEVALAEPAAIDLNITNTYQSSDRNLVTDIKVDFVQELDRNLNLIVVLTESGIVSPQKNINPEIGATPVIEDYIHNHMLRASITPGSWGTQIAAVGTENDESLTKSFAYTLPSTFVSDNCTVVAFVYDTETKEVLQVAEKEL